MEAVRSKAAEQQQPRIFAPPPLSPPDVRRDEIRRYGQIPPSNINTHTYSHNFICLNLFIYIYNCVVLYIILYSHTSCYTLISELGGPSGKSFRLVRACARCVCLVRSGRKSMGRRFPFSLCVSPAFPFSLKDSPAPQGPIQL